MTKLQPNILRSQVNTPKNPENTATGVNTSVPVETAAVENVQGTTETTPGIGQRGDQFQRHESLPNLTGNANSPGSSSNIQGDASLQSSLKAQLRTAGPLGAGRLRQATETSNGQGATSNTSSAPFLGRSGGTGRLGLEDPNVQPARQHAQAVSGQRLDWSNPAQTIDHMSQIDSDQGAQQGGNDAVRCGAASLVAGSVLMGPERFQQGLQRLHQRGTRLQNHYDQLQNIRQNDGTSVPIDGNPQAEAARSSLQDNLDRALVAVDRLRNRNPQELTQGDLQTLQEATYTIGLLDQRLMSDNRSYNHHDEVTQRGYLTTGTMQTYRDVLWGNERPQMNGRSLDAHWVSNENNGGHFVLADEQPTNGSRSIAFNPWPESDGTAYSRANDGSGARIVGMSSTASEGRLRGIDIDAERGVRLPNR